MDIYTLYAKVMKDKFPLNRQSPQKGNTMPEHHVYCPCCGAQAALTANERFSDNSGRATIHCDNCRQSFGAMVVLSGLAENSPYNYSMIGGRKPRLANDGIDPNYGKPKDAQKVPSVIIETDC